MRLALERDGFTVVADLQSARDAVLAAGRLRPDACVLDLALPGALTASQQIRACAGDAALVVMSERPREGELLAALRAGASCYLSKAIGAREFAAAVRDVLAGHARIPRELLPALVHDDHAGAHHRRRRVERRLHIKLTAREWSVVDLLRDGASTEQVALQLEIST